MAGVARRTVSFRRNGGRTVCDNQPSLPDDTRLMDLIAGGDRHALGELVKRHQHVVVELAYRTTGDRALAEDIGQEAFLRVWQSAGRYKPSARLSTWLHRIVVNLCLDAFKKKKPVAGAAFPETHTLTGDASDGSRRHERSAAVRSAVANLPERQRIALVLHRFSGQSIRSVAETTGWSESAVESLLVRAYGDLRKRLADEAKP